MVAASQRSVQYSTPSAPSDSTVCERMPQQGSRKERRSYWWTQNRPAQDQGLAPQNVPHISTSMNGRRYLQDTQDPRPGPRDDGFVPGQRHAASSHAYNNRSLLQGTTAVQRHISTQTVEEMRPQGLLQLCEVRSTTSYVHGGIVMRREVSSDLTWTESTGSRSMGPPSPITPACELSEWNTSYPFPADNFDHMGTQFGGSARISFSETGYDGPGGMAVLPGQKLALSNACPSIQVTGAGDDDVNDFVNAGIRDEVGESDMDIVVMLMPECSMSVGIARADTFPLTNYHSNPDLVMKRKKVPDDLALLETPSTSHIERLAALALTAEDN